MYMRIRVCTDIGNNRCIDGHGTSTLDVYECQGRNIRRGLDEKNAKLC